MDKIYFDFQIFSEYTKINEYVTKKFRKTAQIIKIKESAWNSVFLISSSKPSRRLILKCSTIDTSIKHEHAALLFLKKQGIINVPQEIAYEKFGDLYFLTLSFIENTSKLDAKGQAKLARVLAQVHSIKTRSLGNARLDGLHKLLADTSCMVDYLNQPGLVSAHKKCGKLLQLLNKTIERNESYFKTNKDLVFVNGDLGDDAIYCSGNAVNIIDWHASGFGDNAWDVARLFLNNPGVVDRKLFFKEYLSLIEDQYFIKRFETYWPLNKLFTLLFFFLKSEWYNVPKLYASKNCLEENLDSLLRSSSFAE